jgi:hypothetical protein
MSNIPHTTSACSGETISSETENKPHHITAAERPAAASLDRQAEIVPLAHLSSYKGNVRKHPKAQIRQIADSMARFGFQQSGSD